MKEFLFCVTYLLRLAWSLDRRRLLIGGALILLGALATPVVAVSLKHLVDAAVEARIGDAGTWAVVATAALIGELMLGHFAHLHYFELAEIVEERLNRDLLRVVNGTSALDRCDDPEFADSIDLLRQEIVQMRLTMHATVQLAAVIAQALATAVVLASLTPWYLLLPAIAVVPVVLGKRAERQLQAARERTAPLLRAARHVRVLASSPASQKEVQLCGNAEFLVARQDDLLAEYQRTTDRAQVRHAVLRGTGQLVFGLGYAASVLLAYLLARRGEATAGDIVLVIALATQTSTQMAKGLELLSGVHRSAAGLRRYLDLRDQAGHQGEQPRREMTLDRLASGIDFDHVGFAYPGSAREVLNDITLRIPAGTSVALVGENGAGKSTLIKLLNGLYRPTTGRILVDGEDLARVRPESWRARTAVLFQDFARIELSLQHSVGVGDLSEVDSATAVLAAVRRAKAEPLLDRVGHDLGTVLGGGYADGADLSGGQWQSVGFARGLLRTRPLALSLDEPGHSLDSDAEQRMLSAYQETAARVASATGGVTVYVTHRMSTVRMADLIVVLHEGTIAESGNHDELIAAGGRYADLFSLQARAYAD
ncbi:ABC transporter ATP-binding protein [Lentzea sp. BCCO 10_0798]|uniref:ABC transporter ATP-binding protein n=1 Tax=Lentzea kristufekii TaxID=3095430 RepID=A0ABU4TRL4_9PSEU|nr:ABC transporter ATP-binding protein [Lentzea sp. BCCO 10_0798]MDX8050920.1 ABC transporter ATP-binding protein [Lentzea sp. BCCO 10_0798]